MPGHVVPTSCTRRTVSKSQGRRQSSIFKGSTHLHVLYRKVQEDGRRAVQQRTSLCHPGCMHAQQRQPTPVNSNHHCHARPYGVLTNLDVVKEQSGTRLSPSRRLPRSHDPSLTKATSRLLSPSTINLTLPHHCIPSPSLPPPLPTSMESKAAASTSQPTMTIICIARQVSQFAPEMQRARTYLFPAPILTVQCSQHRHLAVRPDVDKVAALRDGKVRTRWRGQRAGGECVLGDIIGDSRDGAARVLVARWARSGDVVLSGENADWERKVSTRFAVKIPRRVTS